MTANTQVQAVHKTARPWNLSAGNVHAGKDWGEEQLFPIPKCLCFRGTGHPTAGLQEQQPAGDYSLRTAGLQG
jgi:hypothetical protein